MWIGTILGRFTADPVLKTIPKETGDLVLCTFSLATKSSNRTTEFVDITAWRGQAEVIAANCKKGDQFLATVETTTRTYEKDGVRHRVYENRLNSFEFVSSRSHSQENSEAAPAPEAVPEEVAQF